MHKNLRGSTITPMSSGKKVNFSYSFPRGSALTTESSFWSRPAPLSHKVYIWIQITSYIIYAFLASKKTSIQLHVKIALTFNPVNGQPNGPIRSMKNIRHEHNIDQLTTISEKSCAHKTFVRWSWIQYPWSGGLYITRWDWERMLAHPLTRFRRIICVNLTRIWNSLTENCTYQWNPLKYK